MKWFKKNGKLELTIQFKTQTELAFTFLKIAQLADEANHHPDVEVTNCSTLILKLFTHDKNAITEKDMDLALAIEKIIYSYTKLNLVFANSYFWKRIW